MFEKYGDGNIKGPIDYDELHKQYSYCLNLNAKKMNKVSLKIEGGDILCDIGVGTGELIDRITDRFNFVYGVDTDDNAVVFCSKRFSDYKNILIIKRDIIEPNEEFRNLEFDYITALDVLEHLDPDIANRYLTKIYTLLKRGGRFIFTAPNWYDIIGIKLGHSKLHKFSHSSYGWSRMIKRSGLKIKSIESVEFPLLNDNEFLAKHFHIFGKCPLIVAEKV
ncbi:MAG: class I SAM-dependent methyltransferase [Candidatus Methanoperedens sp.]|nr:class I SAM-dependent methyltransferase [Candidatus Methanoperedens sp.]MCZ7396179.1 class I SAM-dependent methyltransferase [Candidatus Methanoperedens sp.]